MIDPYSAFHWQTGGLVDFCCSKQDGCHEPRRPWPRGSQPASLLGVGLNNQSNIFISHQFGSLKAGRTHTPPVNHRGRIFRNRLYVFCFFYFFFSCHMDGMSHSKYQGVSLRRSQLHGKAGSGMHRQNTRWSGLN